MKADEIAANIGYADPAPRVFGDCTIAAYRTLRPYDW